MADQFFHDISIPNITDGNKLNLLLDMEIYAEQDNQDKGYEKFLQNLAENYIFFL